MNYLWSAAAALTNAGGVPGLPAYTLGEKDLDFEGRTIWSLHHGIKKEDSTPVSVFVFDPSGPSSSRNAAPLARNALRKLRALRHPDVLKFLDGSEAGDTIYIITEPVTSLAKRLEQVNALSEEAKMWGLSRLTTALKFINASAASTHGNIRPSSIFLSPSGEWKLGGFDVLCSPKDSDPLLYSMGGLVRESGTYASPEVRRGGYGVLRELDPHVLDAYQLHLLLHVLFNGPLPASFSTELSPSLPTARGSIPASIFPAMRKLGSTEARSRMKIETLCDIGFGLTGQAGAGFFKTNRLVRLQEGLEGFALASESDRTTLVKTVKDSVDVLPPEFLKYKVLPALVHAFEFGQGGPQLLPIVLSLGTSLPPAEYNHHLIQPVVRMFASPDRLMRMALLENFPSFAEKLDQKTVVEKIWPHLLTGFTDVVPVIREATVKAVPFIAPKLSERLLNNDLLRYLAKTQMDAEPGIRTNTCILLGRLSKHLNPSTCRKVLVPAFGRALRDPFVHARIAGLMALMATVDRYEKEDLAAKVIPSMAICLVDKEKTVRDQAFKAIDMFVKRVSELIVGMPDTAIPQPSPNSQTTPLPDASAPAVPGLATNAAGAAGALAGWAFSSLGKKLMPADLASPIQRAASPAPAPAVNGLNGSARPVNVGLHGANASVISLPDTTSTASDQGDWLMDPNADDDDWNNFEEAPAPLEPAPVPAISKLAIQPTRPKPTPQRTTSGSGGTLKLGGATAGRNRSQLAMELEAEAAEEAAPTAAWQAMAAAAAATQAKKAAAAKPVVAAAATRPAARTPTRVVTPAAAPKPAADDNWGESWDDAATPTKAPTPASPTRVSTAPANEDKAAAMARMKAERQARMAALRAARKA